MTDSSQTATQRRGIIKTVIITVLIILVIIALFLHKMLSPRVLSAAELRANGAILFEKPRIVEEFTLVDHTGKPFNLARLQDHWTLIFFGFTQCPEICPNTLAKLAEAYNQLDQDTQTKVEVVLVTVDPARDTETQLSNYVPFFHPEFIGVTGEFLQIMKLTQNLNAAFSKVQTGENDYTIDHTANVAIINPKGHYHGFLKPPLELAKLKVAIYSITQESFPDE